MRPPVHTRNTNLRATLVCHPTSPPNFLPTNLRHFARGYLISFRLRLVGLFFCSRVQNVALHGGRDVVWEVGVLDFADGRAVQKSKNGLHVTQPPTDTADTIEAMAFNEQHKERRERRRYYNGKAAAAAKRQGQQGERGERGEKERFKDRRRYSHSPHPIRRKMMRSQMAKITKTREEPVVPGKCTEDGGGQWPHDCGHQPPPKISCRCRW